MTDLLTTNQVQTLLRVDRTTIYRMVESGRLPAIRVGKQWRFSRADIERWLQNQTAVMAFPVAQADTDSTPQAQTLSSNQTTGRRPTGSLELRDLLPQECVQLIQDAFAEVLGVMMVITDMQGAPITKVSNPCGLYAAITQDPEAVKQCIRSWQDLAANPGLAPRFAPSEMGLLCARGLIRVVSELKGMVMIGGIAPDVWPPSEEQLAQLSQTFGLSSNYVQSNVNAVHRLDRTAQEKALRSVQRIADIFSHIAGDRYALCGRLQAIASLTSF